MQSFEAMILSECQSVGITPTFGMGGKHPYAEWKNERGEKRRFHYPGTPSDQRGELNCRTDLRRMLGVFTGYDAKLPESTPQFVSLRDGEPRCSSLDVARVFDRNHREVLRSIDTFLSTNKDEEWSKRNIVPSFYQDSFGRPQRCFDLSRNGFSIIVMGYNSQEAIAWKIKFLDAFAEMERQIANVSKSAIGQLKQEIDSIRNDLLAATELIFDLSAKSQEKPQSEPLIVKYKRPWTSKRFGRRRENSRIRITLSSVD